MYAFVMHMARAGLEECVNSTPRVSFFTTFCFFSAADAATVDDSTSLSERLSFTIGVANACLTCFFIGQWPHWFHLW
jgi:hypothetical protein